MEATAGAEEGVPDSPRVPEQHAPQSQPEPEPEPAAEEGAPADFGAGLPDEVLRRLLLACAAEGEAVGVALARCAAVHPVWRQVARRTRCQEFELSHEGTVYRVAVWKPLSPSAAGGNAALHRGGGTRWSTVTLFSVFRALCVIK